MIDQAGGLNMVVEAVILAFFIGMILGGIIVGSIMHKGRLNESN